MATVTQWFDGKSPVRIGPYQREFESGHIYYSWWNGTRFSLAGTTPLSALANVRYPSLRRGLRWRGLAENPDA